jgi:1,4-alpha-glucan branching enzyme
VIFFALTGKPLETRAQTFSTRAGWGSTLYNSGCTFRVWAPNATKVTVALSPNYSTTANPLVHDPVYTQGTSWVWSVDVPGVVAGQEYKYYINGTTFKQDPRCREAVSATGNSIIYNTTNFNWAGDNFTPPGLSNAVVYELCIGSFNDPNAPNNPGTFYNATNTLPYLQQLGITAVEVMPINQFPCCYSWGYNPVDIFAADYDAYGGPDAFKTFVKTAHQYGLAVILDTVQNHYGGNDAPSYGDLSSGLWQFDGSYQTIGGTNLGGIYFYQSSECLAFAQTWGPRPDYGTPQVAQFITDNFTMWMSECHVDGFRWDSVGEIVGDYPCSDNGNYAAGSTLVQNICAMIHTGYVGKINIAEDDPYGWQGKNGFDSCWDNNTFFNNVLPQLTDGSDSSRNMGSISYAVNINFDGGGLGGWGSVVFMEDHDQCGAGNGSGAQRLPVRIDSAAPTGYYARKRSMLGSAITLTTCGIPMLLQGEEMLTTNQFGANIPIDWSYTNTYSDIVSYYTDLISLRRNLNGRSAGLTGLNTSTIWEDSGNHLIAYRRWNTGSQGDDVIVICNFANTNWPAYNVGGFPHTNIWYTQLNSDWTKYSSDYGNYGSAATTVSVNSTTGTVSIAPYSVLILSQNTPGAPPTPQNFTVTSVTTNQISLGWNVSSGATGYIVKRDGSPIAAIGTNAYTDAGLPLNTSHCYSVDSTNNLGGVSADSASVCATTLPVTIATNLLAYWTFDEGSGSIAYDSSGNSNTGTVLFGNSGTWTSGMVSNALSLDGDGAQVTVPNSPSLNPVNGITVAAWVYDNSGGWFNTPRLIEKGESDNQYGLFINSSGSLEFLVAGISNGTLTVTPPSSGAWHHLAATYDGSSSISFYIDGLLATQQVASGAMPITTDPLAIGNKPGNTSLYNFFTGDIDDVRIYGSALAPSQIIQLYNIDFVGDGIPDWWRLQWFGSSSSTNSTACTACCAACDADGTGQNNFFDYVAGLNPTDPTQIFTVQIAASNQVMNLTFGPINDGLTYTVQSSPDLVNYSGLASSTAPQTNGSQVAISDLAPWPSNEFYRVQISLPNP